MPLRPFSLLVLAWLPAGWAQLKRQRVGELEPALGGMQGSVCSQGGRDPTEEPLVLLPWALLLALAGSLVIHLLFAKEPRAATGRAWPLGPISSWLKDRSLVTLFGDAPEAADAGADPDTQLEETLLRDVSRVLHIIRLRLWKIVLDRRKQQPPLHKSQ